MKKPHVRTRLTLWYVSVLAAMLALYATGACVFLFWHWREQLDLRAIQDLETIEGLLYLDPQGALHLREDYHNHPESRQVQERYLEVLSPEGRVLFRNDRLRGQPLAGLPFPGEGDGGYNPRTARLADGTRLQLVSRRHTIDNRPVLIRLAYSEDDLWRQLRDLLGALLLTLPAALCLAGGAGYALARRALKPLETMTLQAAEITSTHLHARLPIDNPDDELGQLAAVFNQTLARLELSFEQLRRFTADASHELRTPLAALQSVGEVRLQQGGTVEEHRHTIGSMLEEVTRLTHLTNALLTLSRADSGQIPLQPAVFPLVDLAREAAGLYGVLAEEKQQHLQVNGDAAALVRADRVWLRQAILNLVHNAIQYTPAAGDIALVVHGDAQAITLTIQDNGPGISPEHQSRIFERFYRPDYSRNSHAGGAGLGLSIARWAVESQGGRLTLDSLPAPGCAFHLSLPRYS